MKRTVFCHAIGAAAAILMCLGSPVRSLCQKSTTPVPDTKQTARPATKPPFVLKVKTTPLLNISLKAEKAKMSEVAQELSKQLKTPVFLGPERQKETFTIAFSELTLEPALQLLSPTVYIDYEIDTSSLGPPKALGIYLYDTNQGEPPLTAVVNGSTQSLLIEGDTEDGVDSESDAEKKQMEEKPLRVSFQNNSLSVKAKKQPLPLVLLKIGEEIGIPVDIQDNDFPLIDAEISKLPVEDAVRRLSPHIRLFLRADLARGERRALRLVLTASPKTAQQNP